jgi:hypothetical protein
VIAKGAHLFDQPFFLDDSTLKAFEAAFVSAMTAAIFVSAGGQK